MAPLRTRGFGRTFPKSETILFPICTYFYDICAIYTHTHTKKKKEEEDEEEEEEEERRDKGGRKGKGK